MNWEEFLDPYIQTVGELKIKFRGVRKQYRKANRHSPIEFVTGRVKPIESIREKMILRHIKLENLSQDMQDIAGIRIMVQFVDDVEEVLEIIRKRKDMRVVQERDDIKNMKASGYRSYHVIVEYPVDTINGNQTVLAEIQSSRNPKSEAVSKELWDKLKEANFILTPKNPDIVISIGGDGMLLSAFHKYESIIDRVRFVGIHTGHLGFYTDYRDFEVDKLIANLKLDTGAKVSYPILNVKVKMMDGRQVTARALNEATVKRLSKTMVADVFINNVHFERFRGDGISVSTPTGSTAYNKSLGGAVLHPTIEALQIAEVASLNNRVYRTLGSSIVVPKKDKIVIEPKHDDRYSLSVDNRTFVYDNIDRIEYQLDNSKIHFVATPSHTSFWNRVKDAFIGEVE